MAFLMLFASSYPRPCVNRTLSMSLPTRGNDFLVLLSSGSGRLSAIETVLLATNSWLKPHSSSLSSSTSRVEESVMSITNRRPLVYPAPLVFCPSRTVFQFITSRTGWSVCSPIAGSTIPADLLSVMADSTNSTSQTSERWFIVTYSQPTTSLISTSMADCRASLNDGSSPFLRFASIFSAAISSS